VYPLRKTILFYTHNGSEATSTAAIPEVHIAAPMPAVHARQKEHCSIVTTGVYFPFDLSLLLNHLINKEDPAWRDLIPIIINGGLSQQHSGIAR